jgi:hypothetical protein
MTEDCRNSARWGGRERVRIGAMGRGLATEDQPERTRAWPLQTWIVMGSAATLKMPSKFTASNDSR